MSTENKIKNYFNEDEPSDVSGSEKQVSIKFIATYGIYDELEMKKELMKDGICDEEMINAAKNIGIDKRLKDSNGNVENIKNPSKDCDVKLKLKEEADQLCHMEYVPSGSFNQNTQDSTLLNMIEISNCKNGNEITNDNKETKNLPMQIIMHNGEKLFRCDLCEYVAKREKNIKRHIHNKHEGNTKKKFKCPECSYETKYKCDIKKHLVTHVDIRPYECTVCSRQFKLSHQLKRHTFTHSEEKKFQCAHCNYKSNDKRFFVIHLKDKHLGVQDKEYKCSECSYETNKNFCFKNHLKTHLVNCDKKFKCSQCAYQTHRKNSLNRHLLVHDKIKPFECSVHISISDEKCSFINME